MSTRFDTTEVSFYADAIDEEGIRLGWDFQQAMDFLFQHFGKRSRWLLSDEELVAALDLFKEEN